METFKTQGHCEFLFINDIYFCFSSTNYKLTICLFSRLSVSPPQPSCFCGSLSVYPRSHCSCSLTCPKLKINFSHVKTSSAVHYTSYHITVSLFFQIQKVKNLGARKEKSTKFRQMKSCSQFWNSSMKMSLVARQDLKDLMDRDEISI